VVRLKRQAREVNGAARFAILNKNLCNYPLARDRRSRDWQWRRGSKSGDWYGTWGGDADIKYVWPANTAERRAPTGFDINVLLGLLAAAQKKGKPELHFRSRADLLRLLGWRSTDKNRARLSASLALWSRLSLHFARWYYRDKRHGENRLPPPIRLSGSGQHLAITLDRRWRALANEGYFEKVLLPLPADASAQNLVLCLLVSFKTQPPDDNGVVYTKTRQVRRFGHKLGCHHSRRHQVLHHAIGKAARWFEQHDGSLSHEIIDGRIVFWMKKPVIRRPVQVTHPVSYDETPAKPYRGKRKRSGPGLRNYPHLYRQHANWYPDDPEIRRAHPDGTLVPYWED
jgi:hypothetical protein